MTQQVLNLAIVGCGNIARAYGKSLQSYPQLQLVGATDHFLNLAEDYVATFGGKVYPTLDDMSEAMQGNRPQRITGAQAAHVVDIVLAIQKASAEGQLVQITSGFPQPTPMEWAK